METDLRPAEIAVELPTASDAGLHFIGRIHTPWATRDLCPRQGKPDGPLCRVEVFAPWLPALDGVEAFAQLEILYWLDRAAMARRMAPSRYARRYGPIRSACRVWCWSGARATACWCAAWIAWTARHCWISSRVIAASLPRLQPQLRLNHF